MQQRKRKTRRDSNYLPATLGASFESELDILIDTLAETEGFKGQYLKSEYKSKYLDPNIVTPDARRAAAITKWLATEERNRKTNMRIQLGDADFGWTTSDVLISRARSIIADILGPLEWPILLKGGTHSNGASTRCRRSPLAALEKLAGEAHVSSSALKHWLNAVSTTVLSSQTLTICENSVMFTVPKGTEIDRVACKEPEINMFLQRTVGTHIRKRLRKKGIDLNDQSRNQVLAAEALSRGLCTIDLSSASDSISRQVVFELLPFEWWSLLDDLRVHVVDIDGETHVPEMFSSMGNGFTFELESLLFYALTRAVCWVSGTKGTISVYGDDIIAPQKIGPRLKRTFAWFGFLVNAKKSNWSGPFRESCGKHYYQGREVTPFYLKGPPSQKTDLIRILNRLLQWDAGGTWCLWHPDIIAFHRKWSQHVPSELHGGQDANSITSLVTGEAPRRRLMRKSTRMGFNPQIGLIWWLMEAEARSYVDYTYTCCLPKKDCSYFVGDQPLWLYRTPWEPYALEGMVQTVST